MSENAGVDEFAQTMEIFSLSDWEAASRCGGLARDFFVVRYLTRALARARGAGNDIVDWTCARRDDGVALTLTLPKWVPAERLRLITEPVFEGRALVDFTYNGVPLSQLVHPLGMSVDGLAMGWATKQPVDAAMLMLVYVDAATATSLPRALPPRPRLLRMPADSGVVDAKDGRRWTMTDVSSTRRIGRAGFVGEMTPKQPKPRSSPTDPIEPRVLGPDPSSVLSFEVSRGTAGSPWLRFDATGDPAVRCGLAVLDRSADEASTIDAALQRWLSDPLSRAARSAVRKVAGQHGLDERHVEGRVAAAVVMLNTLKATEPHLLQGAERRPTVDGIAEVVAAIDEEDVNHILRRGEHQS